MDNTLFDIEEYTDPAVRQIMQGNTCRHCAHRIRHCYAKGTFYCDAHPSRRTSCGLLKVKANQPACIRFTHKNNSKQ